MAGRGPTGEVRWVEVEGERLPAWIEEGQVRVELPFDVDFVKLAQVLQEKGYFYAHHPERVDSQGWGRRLDYEGYYPYWVLREGAPGLQGPIRAIFACPPEDYRRTGEEPPGEAHRPGRPGHPVRLAGRGGRAGEEAAGELVPLQPFVGPAAAAEIRRWIPLLKRAKRDRRES